MRSCKVQKMIHNQEMGNDFCYFVIKLSQPKRQTVGPYQLLELMKGIRSGVFAWTDVCKNFNAKENWKRLYEMPELLDLMSEIPTPEELDDIQDLCMKALQPESKAKVVNTEGTPATASTTATAPQSAEGTELPPLHAPLYVYLKGSEFGPLSINEFKNLIKGQKDNSLVYVWYRGLRVWSPLEELPLGTHLNSELLVTIRNQRRPISLYKIVEGFEGRQAERRHLIAGVYARTPQGTEMIGVCADISRTGIQVWLNTPLFVTMNGTEIAIEVVPISISGVGKISFKAAIRWYDEEGMRVGLQFLGNYDGSPEYHRLRDYLERNEFS